MSLLTKYSTPAERDRGLSFMDKFESEALVIKNGGSVSGSPLFSPRGVVLNGTTDYLTYNLTGQEFNSDEISIVVEFTPDFEADEAVSRYLFDVEDGAGNNRTLFFHNSGADAYTLFIGGTAIAVVPEATVSPLWKKEQKNILVVSGVSGDTSTWLNGTKIIDEDNTAWALTANNIRLTLGAIYNGSGLWSGTIHRLQVYKTQLSDQEALFISNGFSLDSLGNGLIQELIDEGVVKLWHDYRAGHALDLSGNGNHGTLDIGMQLSRDGARSTLTTARIGVDNSDELKITEGTLVLFSPFIESSVSYETMLIKNGDYQIYLADTPRVYMKDFNESDRFVNISAVGKRYLAFNFKSGEKAELFLDGISAGETNDTNTFTTSTGAVEICGDDANYTHSTISAAMIINRKLTATEHSQLYAELSAIQYPTKPVAKSDATYGPELMVDGDMEAATTAAWNAGNGATLSKESGNVLGGSQVLRIARNGSNGPYALQSILTVGKTYRVTGWARSDGNAYARIEHGAANVIWTGTTSTSWQYFDTIFTASGLGLICRAFTSTGTEYVEFDNVSVKEIEADVKQWSTGWGTAVTQTLSSGSYVGPWEIVSGTWKVAAEEVNGQICKVLECVTDGTVGIPVHEMNMGIAEAGFGSWQFWIKQNPAGATYPRVGFHASAKAAVLDASQNCYSFMIFNNQAIYVRRVTAGSPGAKFVSVAGLATLGSWHKVLITRSSLSEWYVYFNDELPSAASGANPFTDSTFTDPGYSVVSLYAGDKICLDSVNGDYAFSKYLGVI